jgi:Trk K+ transport system NAD-binding subunit
MKRNQFIIIGLGNTGLELLKKLTKEFDITCIDLNKDSEEEAKKLRSDCQVIVGDATSRLILEEAGAAEADGIIITTRTEKVNIETVRILKEHFESRRVIAIGSSKAGIDELESLGVEVENIFTASATAIRNKLEHTSRAAHAIGLGKNEILEVEVHPHSRLANRPLRMLTPIRWKIGLIYRDENIIVPRNDTVLKAKDRVIILGEPSVLKTVSEILTFKFQRFPLEYGSTIIAYVYGNEPEEFFNEIDYLFSVFPLNRIIVLLSKKAAPISDIFEQHFSKTNIKGLEIKHSPIPLPQAIQQATNEIKKDQGLIVFWKKTLLNSFFPFLMAGKKKKFISNLLKTTDCPVLTLNGTFPYEKVAVPCVEDINLQHTLETSLEISASLNNEITAMLTNPSKYISSDEDLRKFDEMKKAINEVSLMYKSSVIKDTLNGNPVKSITEALRGYNLMITDPEGWIHDRWYSHFLSPDIIWHIFKSSNISTLLLPHAEEAL